MGKAPSPPNPVTTANAQTDSNRATAITQFGLNAVNQRDALGNTQTWNQIGTWADGTPRYETVQQLGAGSQALLDSSQKTQLNLANLAQEQSGRLSGLLNQPLNFSGLPSAGQVPGGQRYGSGPSLNTTGGDTSGIVNSFDRAGDIQMQLGDQDSWGRVKDVENALFSRLNPQIDRQRQALETDLVNRGIRPGSAAYAQQMETFNQGLNDQRTSVLLNAGQEQNRMQQLAMNTGNFTNAAQAQNYNQLLGRAQFGNQAQAQLYGQQFNNAQFGNAANQQMYQNGFNATQANNALDQQQFVNQNLTRTNALNEMLLQRNTPLNELLALSGQTQLQQPSFVSTPQTGVGGTDVAGITNANYAQQMQQYNSNQGLLGGLFSAGASLVPLLSDRRSKTDIQRVGKLDNGLNVYLYKYWGEEPYHIGVMADEVKEIHPDAVVRGDDGMDRVFYDKAVA